MSYHYSRWLKIDLRVEIRCCRNRLRSRVFLVDRWWAKDWDHTEGFTALLKMECNKSTLAHSESFWEMGLKTSLVNFCYPLIGFVTRQDWPWTQTEKHRERWQYQKKRKNPCAIWCPGTPRLMPKKRVKPGWACYLSTWPDPKPNVTTTEQG